MRRVLFALIILAGLLVAGAAQLNLYDVQDRWRIVNESVDFRSYIPDIGQLRDRFSTREDSTVTSPDTLADDAAEDVAFVPPEVINEETEEISLPPETAHQPMEPITPIDTSVTPARIFHAGFEPADSLFVCWGMTVSNAPRNGTDLSVLEYAPFIDVSENVDLLINPAEGSCISSGFGERNGRSHSGVDFYARPAVMIHAGGDGVIREAGYRDDFGNYVLIDHGDNVFTRYAHLAYLDEAIDVDLPVMAGQPLGMMGNSSAYDVAVHLHYEVLVGDYDTPAQSFGLEARNPFDYPFVP